MHSEKNSFEDRLGKRLRDGEMPFEEQAWANFQAFQKDHDGKVGGGCWSKKGLLSAGFILLLGSVSYFLVTNYGSADASSESQTPHKQKMTANSTNESETRTIKTDETAPTKQLEDDPLQRQPSSNTSQGNNAQAKAGTEQDEAATNQQQQFMAASVNMQKYDARKQVFDRLDPTTNQNAEVTDADQKTTNYEDKGSIGQISDASQVSFASTAEQPIPAETINVDKDVRATYGFNSLPILTSEIYNDERTLSPPKMIKPNNSSRWLYSLGVGYVLQEKKAPPEITTSKLLPLSLHFGITYENNKYRISSGLQLVTQQHLSLNRSLTSYFQSAAEFKYFERQYYHKSHVNLGLPITYHRYLLDQKLSWNAGLVFNYTLLKDVVYSSTNTNFTSEEIDSFLPNNFDPNDYVADFSMDVTAGVEYHLTRRFSVSLQGYLGLTNMATSTFWEPTASRSKNLIFQSKMYF